MRNTVRCQKPTGKFRSIPGDRRGRTASRARHRRSRHGSTRSNSRQYSGLPDKPRRHSPVRLLTCRVCGWRWCSRSGLSVTRNYGELTNFFSLSSVILLCSPAAIGSSVAASFSIRWRRAASISSEVFPVAQMIKMKPNFCS